MTNYLKQIANEQGFVLNEQAMISIDDVKHNLKDSSTMSHGELIQVLEDFYHKHHEEIYDAVIELLQDYLDTKSI